MAKKKSGKKFYATGPRSAKHDGQGPGPAVFDAPSCYLSLILLAFLIQNGIKTKSYSRSNFRGAPVAPPSKSATVQHKSSSVFLYIAIKDISAAWILPFRH